MIEDFLRRQLAFLCVGGTLFVIAVQAGVDNALCDRLTTGAAGFPVFIFVTDSQVEVFGNIQTAVETGFFHGISVSSSVVGMAAQYSATASRNAFMPVFSSAER